MSFLRKTDERVLEHITLMGGNLKAKRVVDFYFNFSIEYNVMMVEMKLTNSGFETPFYINLTTAI